MCTNEVQKLIFLSLGIFGRIHRGNARSLYSLKGRNLQGAPVRWKFGNIFLPFRIVEPNLIRGRPTQWIPVKLSNHKSIAHIQNPNWENPENTAYNETLRKLLNDKAPIVT